MNNVTFKRFFLNMLQYVVISMLLVACKTSTTLVENTSKEKITEESFQMYTEKIPATDLAFDMVLVPQGNFMMGSTDAEAKRKGDEGPQHQVAIASFWAGKYEVTWEIFELFFKQNKELFTSIETDKLNGIDAITRPSPPYEDPSYGMGKEGYPAVSMSAYSALVFCKWVSTITGRFYRLPTEAEWEYAARAGNEETYSFGNDLEKLNDYAVFYKNSNGQYAKVGTKLPNAWGLYDMHGNAAEWTLDEYKESAYVNADANNPWVIPTVVHPRVIRGGSWDDDADKLRSASRTKSSVKLQKRDPQIPKSFWWFTDSNFVGFRLVSPKKQPSQLEQKKFWQTVLDE